MRTITVDCHVHLCQIMPSRKRGLAKARRMLKEMADHEINAAIITEHSWREPKLAYDVYAEAAKATGSDILLVPAVETLTREGIDVIVFSSDPSFYDDPELAGLFKSKVLSVEEVLELVAPRESLNYFFPHPRGLSKTAVERHDLDFEFPGGTNFEVRNGAFHNLSRVWDRYFSRVPFVSGKISRRFAEATKPEKAALSEHFHGGGTYQGSDAHSSSEIHAAFCLQYEIEDDEDLTLHTVFEALLAPQADWCSEVVPTDARLITRLSKQTVITTMEATIKRLRGVSTIIRKGTGSRASTIRPTSDQGAPATQPLRQVQLRNPDGREEVS